MRVIIGASVLTACLVGAIAVQAQQQAPPAGGGQRPGGAAPQAPKNLQVLPKDWTIQQVSAFMRNFTVGLGVQCAYCHAGTPQDRALDDKKEKLVARKMITMMMAINDTYLKDVGEPIAAVAPAAPGAPPAPPPMKVTCYTCHRGTTKPLTAPAPGGGGHQTRLQASGSRLQ